MPPKNKPNNKPSKKPIIYDKSIQTDDEALQLSNCLKKRKEKEIPTTSSSETDDMNAVGRQTILNMHIKKLSIQNAQLKLNLKDSNSRLKQMFDKLRLIKTDIQASKLYVKDELAVMNLMQENFVRTFSVHLKKHKELFENQRQKLMTSIKTKNGKIAKLKEEERKIAEQRNTIQLAFESEACMKRIAQKESFNSNREAREIKQKLDDKLFLATNQRCPNCEVKKNMQDKLQKEIVEKIMESEELRRKILSQEQEIAEKDRINKIITDDLTKTREDMKKAELNKDAYNNQLKNCQHKLIELTKDNAQLNETLKNMKSKSNNTAKKMTLAASPPVEFYKLNMLTPPEDQENASDTDVFNGKQKQQSKAAGTINNKKPQPIKPNTVIFANQIKALKKRNPAKLFLSGVAAKALNKKTQRIAYIRNKKAMLMTTNSKNYPLTSSTNSALRNLKQQNNTKKVQIDNNEVEESTSNAVKALQELVSKQPNTIGNVKLNVLNAQNHSAEINKYIKKISKQQNYKPEDGELLSDTTSNGSSVQEIRFFNQQPITKKAKNSIPRSFDETPTSGGIMHLEKLQRKIPSTTISNLTHVQQINEQQRMTNQLNYNRNRWSSTETILENSWRKEISFFNPQHHGPEIIRNNREEFLPHHKHHEPIRHSQPVFLAAERALPQIYAQQCSSNRLVVPPAISIPRPPQRPSSFSNPPIIGTPPWHQRSPNPSSLQQQMRPQIGFICQPSINVLRRS